MPFLLTAAALLVLSATEVAAQDFGNPALSGTYYFRQTLIHAPVGDGDTSMESLEGKLTFDGSGNVNFQAEHLVDAEPSQNLSVSGTYEVQPGGFVRLTNPLDDTLAINARLAEGALVGSSTYAEAAEANVFDLLIAIPAATEPLSNETLYGSYWVTSLEFPQGSTANTRATRFKLTSNGAGAFQEITVTGHAANLGNTLFSQTIAPITYHIAPDATGLLTFPLMQGQDRTSQLIGGAKAMAISADGDHFIAGGREPGDHGFVIGVRATPPGAELPAWSGFFYAAGMRFDADLNRLATATASLNVTATATSNAIVWARRVHQSDGLFDASTLTTFSLSADGSGPLLSTAGHVQVADSGEFFSTTGVGIGDSPGYELYFGARIPPQSGTGVFLNPQGVLNAASFAPPGYPISPGGFITLFGSGLSEQSAVTQTLPFPTTLAGVQVRINGVLAPLYSVADGQISCIVPYEVSGSIATIMVANDGIDSNVVEVPLAASAPGIFSLTQNGLNDAAALHLDYSVIDQDNPAAPGEAIQIYLTGMGAVDPPVMDGTPAPGAEPLARTVGPLAVTIGGRIANVLFSGLAPTLAGLYQLNVEVPEDLEPGVYSLAVQTLDGFTDMVDLRVQ